MNRPEAIQLEPFAEVSGDTYRFGYRIVGTIDCVSAVELPATIVELTVLARASLTARVAPDGTVISHMLMSAGCTPDLSVTDGASIDALVQKAVDSENLRMEEATAGDLSTLLLRLEDSVRLVKDVMSELTGETKTENTI